jgi:peptidoglycan/LPS O-acetylase OafA/YrhL
VSGGAADLLTGVVGGFFIGGATYVVLRGLRISDEAVSSGDVAVGPRRLRPMAALDGLRGVAILLVLLAHTQLVFIRSWSVFHRGFGVLSGGSLGVDLFFVLSGFLITALLLREQSEHGRVGFGNFYRNRALRLLPALVVMIAVVLVFAWATAEPMGNEIEAAAYGLFYVSNWHGSTQHFGHLWSLSVEEQFYLVWPALVLVFFGLRRNVTAVAATLVGIVAAIAIRRFLAYGTGANWAALYQHTDTRADSLLVGALLACLWVRRLTPTRHLRAIGWASVAVFLACVAFARASRAFFPPSSGFLYQGGFLLFACASAGVILATLDGRWSAGGVLVLRPLRALGRVSYGVYLWHVPIFYEVARRTHGWATWTRIALAWGITCAATIASWRLVERPFLSLKRRPSIEPDPVLAVH